MHITRTDDETNADAPPARRSYRRWFAGLGLLIVLLLLAFIPPLVSVTRFQLRIARNISASIGRPVHFDRVSLDLLPLPGFTLENFVVDEDPAFGSEPILRAGEVRATLRISSLWKHVEFSKISLSAGSMGIDPSVNLVRNASGRWNFENLLSRASRIQAAPTGQSYAGPERRFPYIEATGARLNLKLGEEKTPFSLTDADFALWLPEPHQWHLRVEANPQRTDTQPGDTGTVRVEGTIGAADLGASSLAQIPIDFHGDWQDAQLGGLSRFAFGHDSGLRGDVSLDFTVRGTIGHNAIAARIGVEKARRAEFVPEQLLSLDARCTATVQNNFKSYTGIACNWPPAGSSGTRLLALTADVPDVRDLRSASLELTLPAVPASSFFDWLRVATPNAPAGKGTLAGNLAYGPDPRLAAPLEPHARRSAPVPTPPSDWSGRLEFTGASIELDHGTHRSLPLGDVVLSSPPAAVAQSATRTRGATFPVQAPDSFDLQPVVLPLGAKQPATVEGHLDSTGYTLHLSGTVVGAQLLELANAVPQLGNGLQPVLNKIAAATPDSTAVTGSTASSDHVLSTVPIRVDLTATRTWGSGQSWSDTSSAPPPSGPRHHR